MEQAALRDRAVQRGAFANLSADALQVVLRQGGGQACASFVERVEERRPTADEDAEQAGRARRGGLAPPGTDDWGPEGQTAPGEPPFPALPTPPQPRAAAPRPAEQQGPAQR